MYKRQRKDNHIALYRKTFEVPASWEGQNVLIHFAGVRGAFYLYVNGKKEQSGLPAPARRDVDGYRALHGSFLPPPLHQTVRRWRISRHHAR